MEMLSAWDASHSWRAEWRSPGVPVRLSHTKLKTLQNPPRQLTGSFLNHPLSGHRESAGLHGDFSGNTNLAPWPPTARFPSVAADAGWNIN